MTYPKGKCGECLVHHKIRCGECEYVAELESRIEQLEAIRQFYADPTIYDAREGMAILKDCGDKAREGIR